MNDTQATTEALAVLAPFHSLIDMGGPVMVVLLSLSVLGLATAFYTLIIGILQAPRSSATIRQAVARWSRGDYSQARDTLARSRNPLAGVLSFAMQHRLEGEEESGLREDIARRAQRLVMPFESPLKVMEVIAALAPLLGLLGTVMGMMSAFDAMATAEGQANPSQLSGGIYEALSTTAAGLIIAIPFAALAAFIEFRLRRLQQHMNDLLVQIFRAPLPGKDEGNSKEFSVNSNHSRETDKRHAMA